MTTMSADSSAASVPSRMAWKVVGDDLAAQRFGAPGLGQGAEHEAVELDQFAGLWGTANLDQLAAGGDDGDAGRGDHVHLGVAGGGEGAEIAGFEAAALGEHELGGHDVLAHRADVLPGRGGGGDLDRAVAAVVDVFDHDHGVGVGRHGVAGVDPDGLGVQLEVARRGLGSADGAGGGYGHTVHGGGGKVRAGEGRPDGRGGDVAEGLVQRQPLRVRRGGQPGSSASAFARRSRAVARGTSVR